MLIVSISFASKFVEIIQRIQSSKYGGKYSSNMMISYKNVYLFWGSTLNFILNESFSIYQISMHRKKWNIWWKKIHIRCIIPCVKNDMDQKKTTYIGAEQNLDSGIWWLKLINRNKIYTHITLSSHGSSIDHWMYAYQESSSISTIIIFECVSPANQQSIPAKKGVRLIRNYTRITSFKNMQHDIFVLQ